MKIIPMKHTALIALLLLVLGSPIPAATQPNILVILVDDIGVADFGFSGGKDIPTPNIDRLAREGVICTSAYVQPMCAPTRAMLLTGRYPQRLGYEDNRPFDTAQLGLDKSVPTLPEKLRDAGYATALVGKWHLGKGEHFEFAPRNRGFDEFFGYFGAMGNYANLTYSRNGAEKMHEGYGTDILTNEAITRIAAWKDKPFFLHLAYTAAHLKQEAKAEDLAKFAHLDKKRQMAAAIISNLDANIGRLMQSLKDTGIAQNTLTFFLSDNGAEPAVLGTRNDPYRGQKFDLYEGGVRVPFVAHWPGVLPTGARYDKMVSAMDIMPTCLALAEAEAVTTDGIDLLPVLSGKSSATPHDTLFWRTTEHTKWRAAKGGPVPHLSAMREGDWKLIVLDEEGANTHELYHLATDASEAHDLAAQEPVRLQAMRATLDEWRATLKPQVIAPSTKAAAKKPAMVIPAGGPVPALNIKAQEQHPDPSKDRFGGDTRTQLAATGNFRVEQVKGRWLFITPDGHPYIALGANHTGPTIRDQGRMNGLWKRWNDDPDLTAKEMLKIIQGMGFTAGDVYQPEATYTRTLPWISFFWYGDANHTFVDVFNEQTMADVTRRAFEHAQSVADNPWVLGIGGPDLSMWDDKLVRKYREMKPNAPGRQRYAAFIRERYANDIAKFNQTYGAAFASFDDLATQGKLTYPGDLEDDKIDPWTVRWRLPVPAEKSAHPEMTRDNDAFCALIASTLFPQVRAAVKRGAPHHLFLGEHLAVRMIPDAVIATMAPHIDAYLAQAVEVSPQRPPEWQIFQRERWDAEYALLQKPIIIVDWGAVFSFDQPFEYKGATIKSEREASDDAAKFIGDAFERPYIIGLFLCKLLGDHRNDANFFQNRATRTYLKPDATAYPYRTERLKRALREVQARLFNAE